MPFGFFAFAVFNQGSMNLPSEVGIRSRSVMIGVGGFCCYWMFCTCSRICSIKTFSSIEAREVSAHTALAPRVLASRLSS